MQWSNVKWVFLREVRDQLRDRRTMFTIAVLPVVLYPLLGMGFLQVAQFAREHPTQVLVLGASELPDSPSLLVDDQFAPEFVEEREARLLKLTIHESDPPPSAPEVARQRDAAESAVQSGEYAAALYFPPDFGSRLAAFRADLLQDEGDTDQPDVAADAPQIPNPEIFVSSASDKSRIARDRVGRVLQRWREAIGRENLIRSQVRVEATTPFQFVDTDVSHSRSRRAAVWSKILPFIVLIWALTGAFYPAVDLCAGEKERGTLETLLCSPAGRSEIVWGKLLTIMSFSIATSLLNLASMGLTGLFVVSQVSRLAGPGAQIALGAPPLPAFGWILLTLLPISALFSALSLAIAAFARSSKEGQYYLMPLLLITLPLMMLPLMPTAELDLGTSLIPVTGMMLLLRSLIEGHYLDAVRFGLPVVGVTLACCLLAVRWAIDQFNNESVLFRESERWSIGVWLRHMVRDRRETPSISEAIFCGIVLLIIRFFASFMVDMPSSWAAFSTMTVISLIAFVAAPALLMTVVLTRSPRKTLLLRWPRPAALPMAVLLAVVVHPLGIGFAEGVKTLYPFNDDILKQLEAVSGLIGQAPGLWAILGVLALAPALCEELAFRGFILSGFRHLGHKWGAIVASSLFFGATHGILQQSMTAFGVGIVIGYIAIQTGSLLPGILFHLTYNSLSLLLATEMASWVERNPALEWLFSSQGGSLEYHWSAVAASCLCTAAVLSWFRSLPFEISKEEALQEALDRQPAATTRGKLGTP